MNQKNYDFQNPCDKCIVCPCCKEQCDTKINSNYVIVGWYLRYPTEENKKIMQAAMHWIWDKFGNVKYENRRFKQILEEFPNMKVKRVKYLRTKYKDNWRHSSVW